MKTLPRRSAITAAIASSYLAMNPAAGDEPDSKLDDEAAMTAPEDLMREHGILNRLMLVYEAALTPPVSNIESIHEVLHGTASLIRSFVEDYHGMLEEKFLFPEFDRQRSHASLVGTLRDQHRIGRALTGVLLRHATADGLANETTRTEVLRACRDFIRMFRAHEAWEDTVLFPAFRRLVSPARLRELGQEFEDIEHRSLGKDGFAETVAQVVRLEHHVGIESLEMFTPRDHARASP